MPLTLLMLLCYNVISNLPGGLWFQLLPETRDDMKEAKQPDPRAFSSEQPLLHTLTDYLKLQYERPTRSIIYVSACM